MEYLQNLYDLSLAAAPWLVLGLLIGGLIKVLIPMSFLEKHLGGQGFVPVVKAALLGAPLPLCSCGVIPAALGLRKAGASKQSTVSFLVSTPETGVDSVSITYALLGPFMAIVRPVAAIISAITAGLLVGRTEIQTTNSHQNDPIKVNTETCCAPEKGVKSCCEPDVSEATASCCAGNETQRKEPGLPQKISDGIRYAFTDLYSMLLFWLCIGLLFAAAVKTYIPASFLVEWGSGLPAMLVMVVIGIPMYVCATASTPIAAGFMLAGVSPGTALVFLMAGPATNISTLGVIGKELGLQSLLAYLTGVGVVAIIAGLFTDYLVNKFGIDVQGQLEAGLHFVPHWVAISSLIVLIATAVYSLKPEQV